MIVRRRLFSTGTTGVIVTFAAGAVARVGGLAAVAPPPVELPAVAVIKALAWPIVVIVLAVTFRRSLDAFASSLGDRISKLSVFSLQLELLPATAATATPLLDDIRTATSSAAINDSTRAMLEQVQVTSPADFAVIALGDGEEWLTSRLYIAAVMLQRMRDVKVVVFVERATATERRLVAVASVHQLRWSLAMRYPWLEAAWARVSLSIFPPNYTSTVPPLPADATWLPDPRTLTVWQPPITSDTGGFEPGQARQLVSQFIDVLQRAQPTPEAPAESGWVTLRDSRQERAQWVTRALLASLLPEQAFSSWTDVLRDAPRARRTRAVLRRRVPFVALVEGDREFVRLANRGALLEEIAASLGEEPEVGSSSRA